MYLCSGSMSGYRRLLAGAPGVGDSIAERPRVRRVELEGEPAGSPRGARDQWHDRWQITHGRDRLDVADELAIDDRLHSKRVAHVHDPLCVKECHTSRDAGTGW